MSIEWQAHEILGVSKTASEAEIRAAWRQRAKELHPDRGGSAALFDLTQKAYHSELRRVQSPAPAQTEVVSAATPTATKKYNERVATLRSKSTPFRPCDGAALLRILPLFFLLYHLAFLSRFLAVPERVFGITPGTQMLGGRDMVYYGAPRLDHLPGGYLTLIFVTLLVSLPTAILWVQIRRRAGVGKYTRPVIVAVIGVLAFLGEFILHTWRWLPLLLVTTLYLRYLQGRTLRTPEEMQATPNLRLAAMFTSKKRSKSATVK